MTGTQLTMRDLKNNRSRSFVLSADPDTPMATVVPLLHSIFPGPIYLGERLITTKGTFADSGIHAGSILTVGQPTSRPTQTGLEFAVVGGPGAGITFPLRDGTFVAGRGPDVDIVIPDRQLAPVQFRIAVSGDFITVDSRRGRGAVAIDGVTVTQSVELLLDETAQAGASIFQVRESHRSDADVRTREDGVIVFNTPARIQPAQPQSSFSLPQRPVPPEKPRFPWVQVIAPIVFAGGAAYFFHSPAFLLLSLMSPVMAVSSTYGNRKDQKRKAAEDLEKYQRDMSEVTEQIADSARMQGIQQRYRLPDAGMLHDMATLPTRRLWERRNYDSDFLTLRVGSATQHANIKIDRTHNSEDIAAPSIYCSPIGVSLPQVGVLGIAGNMATARAVGRWLVSQIAILHSPNDVQLYLLADNATKYDWDWTRWLPHMVGDDQSGTPFRHIASDQYVKEAHIKHLLNVLTERKEALKDRERELHGPAIVVVYDGIRALRNIPGVSRLLKEGPDVGIFAIGLDSESSQLAQETRAEIAVDAITAGIGKLLLNDLPEVDNIAIDQVTSLWTDSVARALAPIVEAGVAEAASSIPSYVRFVDLLNLDLNNPDAVLGRWLLAGRSTKFVVGSSFDGPFALDLKADGPHGLVAGTTGAGKSEFLQTAIASLALVNRPDALNFLLIDYKGASAFAACAEFPHTVGLVTNLNSHLTMRALTALDADLERREHILHSMQASDIDTAWRRDPQRCAEEGLARLLIVIDEFAELSQELPDFVSGLIRVARVGRSLGVHLILGTQRPTGVVSAEMRANTGLRIALRVEDRHDSTEVIDDPAAAGISRNTPGRAYARLGGGGGLIPFQTARVAGRRPGATRNLPEPVIVPVKWEQLGRPLPFDRAAEAIESETTDLHAIVELVNKAAVLSGVPRPRSPWLPPLPEKYALASPTLEVLGDAKYAIEDRPADQTQPDVHYDLENGTHLLIFGSARSGRSTALRTLAGSLSNTWSPQDLHLHAMDFGNGAMLPLTSLPHCGVVTSRTETDRIERFIARILDEIARRQTLMSGRGWGDISEQRQQSPENERLPYIVILLDRWEGFLSEFGVDSGSDAHELMQRVTREGSSVGIRLVIAGDRALISDRIASLVEDKFVMRLASPDDYTLANLKRSDVPEDMPAGRAIHSGTHLHRQFALLSPQSDTASQAAVIMQIAAISRQRLGLVQGESTPMQIDPLPSTVSYGDAKLLDHGESNSALTALVGIGGDVLTAVSVDLADHQYFTIAGPSGSGRTNTALAMAESLLDRGTSIIAICPRRSELESLAGHANAWVFKGQPAELQQIIETVNQIEHELCFVIDDCQMIVGNPVDEMIRDVISKNPSEAVAIVVGTIDEMKTQLYGLPAEARKSKVGVLFSPQYSMDGDLLGLRLPRRMVGRNPPGRGIFCRHGNAAFIQVPTECMSKSPPV